MYEGEWKDGKPHGRGKCIYADGVLYEGEWKDGQSHGYGKIKSQMVICMRESGRIIKKHDHGKATCAERRHT